MHDRTCISVCHSEANVIYLDYMLTLQGNKEKRVSIAQVEEHLSDLLKQYRVSRMLVDAWQMESALEKFQARGIACERFTFSLGNHDKLTTNLLTLFREGRIKLPRLPSLIEELGSVYIEVANNGSLKIEHSASTHNDQVISLGMCCLACVAASQARPRFSGAIVNC